MMMRAQISNNTACGFRSAWPQPVVLVRPHVFRDNRLMDPSPGPWTFSEHMYGIGNCLIDRDGRVIGLRRR